MLGFRDIRRILLRKEYCVEEMAQCLRAHTFLAQNTSLVLSICVGQLTTALMYTHSHTHIRDAHFFSLGLFQQMYFTKESEEGR